MVASKTPKKKRVVRRPPKPRTSPCVMVTKPKPNIIIDTEAYHELMSNGRSDRNVHQT